MKKSPRPKRQAPWRLSTDRAGRSESAQAPTQRPGEPTLLVSESGDGLCSCGKPALHLLLRYELCEECCWALAEEGGAP